MTLSPEVLAMLEALEREWGTSRSAAVERVVREYAAARVGGPPLAKKT